MADVESNIGPAAGSPTPSHAGPAVSARILKKRETDRRCQRMIRERTKSRIAYLEGLVEEFRKQDSSGRVETLMKQLAEMKSERDVLAKKMKNIESILSGGKSAKDQDEPTVPEENTYAGPIESSTPKVPETLQSTIEHTDAEVSTYKIYNKEFEARTKSWATSPASTAEKACDCSLTATSHPPIFSKWKYANDTLSAWFNWPKDCQTIRDQQLFDDTGIRGVIEGWDAVERRGNVHPAWHLLRGIDQNIFGHCNKLDRLAIMRVMSLLMGAHMNPTTEQHAKLPAFYLKRPSQDMLHSYAIEYFAWPGLRERFIYSEHRYCANNFWKIFCDSMKFLWPYEVRDCYNINTATGLYQISPAFHNSLYDIRHWAMGREFFQTFPELYSDIPAWNHVPASITPMTTYRQAQIQAAPTNEQLRCNTEDSSSSSTSEEIEATSAVAGSGNYSTLMPRTNVDFNFAFGTGVQDSTYDYTLAQFMQSVNDGQQLPPVTNSWFNTGLDIFALDAA